ncbi:hypothetical protein OEA41_001811 [Lepraria neglecta]|uniref:Transcription factor CBF/NF-Y/archaeal histone domain-containing protein n=1 Tax=Lepraria neglecta TaxID=209136 RepID=A0AAD9ZAE6_9LECA|nr:hypothetical protein OEA41_001811 [Lepraria neglecta]
MPYNNAAIPPPEEISGQASLPLARVKKILQIDEDTVKVSNNAAFVITIATEMFIRHLAEQAMNVAKLDKKPRRNIQYKDLANAVARIDNLQFLEDVIPRTTTYREYKAKKASKATTQGPPSLQNGQTTLDGSRPLPQRPAQMADPQRATMDDGNMSDGTIDEPSVAQTQPARVNGNAGLVFEHYEPNGTTRRDESGDVEMG